MQEGNNTTGNDYYEDEYAKIQFKKGIVFISYKEGVIITYPIMKNLVKERLKLTEDATCYILADIRGIKYITGEARQYLKKGDAIRGVKGGAFIMNNIFHQIAGNYFLKIKPPIIPTRLFTEDDKAFVWLEQLKERKLL